MVNAFTGKQAKNSFDFYRIVSILLILASLFFIIHRAWYCDDAFITFRTLDNFVNGYHLTWNIYERVQVYTHPLWLFLLIPFYAVTREIFLTVIVICVTLSVLALFFLNKSVDDKKQLILPLVVLAFSNAFINFSTSGLENALLNVLFSLFFFVYVKKQNSKFSHITLYLLFSLIALTRLDAILVVLPVVFFEFFTDRRRFGKKLLLVVLGFSPLILWELFSLIYYGFPFPNTFYAKLTAGFPLSEYIQRGWIYFLDTLKGDPVTAIGLIVGCAAFLFVPKRMKLFSLGIFAYFLYIFTIGGDFMSGRMYSSLIFAAMALAAHNTLKIKTWLLCLLTGLIIILGFFASTPTPILFSPKPIEDSISGQVYDERQYFFGGTSLFRNNRFNTSVEMDNKVWGFGGYNWIAQERAEGKIYELPVFILTPIGLFGYFGGPDVKIIDEVGLADPLIAHLPAVKNPGWRVGHLVRVVPEGYPQSVATPGSKLADKNLDEYNNHLKVLTQGDLFAKGRLLEILRFNLGYYDYLIK